MSGGLMTAGIKPSELPSGNNNTNTSANNANVNTPTATTLPAPNNRPTNSQAASQVASEE